MKPPAVLRWLLWPASLLFQGVVRARAWCYRHGIFKQRRLNGVVISVGNLTVGGTGKTPMVIWIAQRLIDEGKHVGILTRGYRGAARAGAPGVPSSDEVEMIRGRLSKNAQVAVGANRYDQGLRLERNGVEWFVLDDGFQHLRLARHVDLVLIDATDPFGGGYLLPAGRLREPRSALSRADIVVITRSEHAPAVEAVVRRHTRAPVFYAQTHHGLVRELCAEYHTRGDFDWARLRLFAFCGIGNPAAFFDDLHRWGLEVVGRLAFPDHHRYSGRDTEEIQRRAQAASAEALVCTEKDIYNLRTFQSSAFPVVYCEMALRPSNPQAFWQAVRAAIERKRPGAAR